MALVLGINIESDNRIFVGKTMITIDQIVSFNKTKITVHGAAMDNHFTLDTERMTGVLPQVKMGLGKDTNRGGFVRVLMQAPRSMHIERGSRLDESETES